MHKLKNETFEVERPHKIEHYKKESGENLYHNSEIVPNPDDEESMISLQGKIEIFNKIPADSTIQQFTKVLSAPRYGFDSMNNSLTQE